MALPLPITPTDIGALTPNTRSEAEAALTFNALHQTSSSGPPKPFFPRPEYSMHRRQSHNYLDAATEAGLPPSTCEPPYPTEETAEQIKGSLSRGTTQAVLQKMDSLSVSKNSSGETRVEHTHVAFASQSTVPELDGGMLSKRLSREGQRRLSSNSVPGPASLEAIASKDTTGEAFEKPSFDRSMSWKREDKKRALYQQEKLMEAEQRFGKNYGYDSASEEQEHYGQF